MKKENKNSYTVYTWVIQKNLKNTLGKIFV